MGPGVNTGLRWNVCDKRILSPPHLTIPPSLPPVLTSFLSPFSLCISSLGFYCARVVHMHLSVSVSLVTGVVTGCVRVLYPSGSTRGVSKACPTTPSGERKPTLKN